MKKGKKIICALLGIVTAVVSMQVTAPVQLVEAAEREVVSRVVTGENGKSYVEVDGKPFMYENVENMGTWQRNGFDCDSIEGYAGPLPVSWMENVFEKTKFAGYNTVSLFFDWSDIEPENEGEYDWTLLDQYIEWADKYDVRLSLTWFGSDAGGGTRLPGYSAGWSCHVPGYLQNQEKYWNKRPVDPDTAYTKETRFRAPTSGPVADYIKSCEKNALIALTEHLRDYDKTHRMISLMINNESQNIPDSWHSELAYAVKSVGYDFVLGQHQQKAQYRKLDGYDFVGFDDYSTSLANKQGWYDKSPTALKICLESGGNANNLSSQVLHAITNGAWLEAWQLCDAYSNCYQLGMYEAPDANYGKNEPDYLTWKVGEEETLKYGAKKNKNLQLALQKAYWVIAQASKDEMLSFNLETDEPVADYKATKRINGHAFGFESDGPDKVRGKGSNAMIANKNDYYYCLSDTGIEVTFLTDAPPISAEYGYQDENGEWVCEADAKVVQRDDGTWAVTCGQSQVLRLELEQVNAAPVFAQDTFTKTVIQNMTTSGQVEAEDENYWDVISYRIGEQPKHGTAEVKDDGTWSYTPEENYVGEDSFTVEASDGKGGTAAAAISITVKEANSAPIFDADAYELATEANTIAGGVFEAMDEDDDDVLTYSIRSQPSHGTVIIAADGQWTYTPAKDYTGTDSFTVTAQDSLGASADAVVNLTVNPASDDYGTNLALNKEIEASSVYSNNRLAAYAVDGDPKTLWAAKSGDFPQTLTVDLGAKYNLAAAKLQITDPGDIWTYKLEGSNNNKTWTILTDRMNTGIKDDTKVTEIIEGAYRYVKWTITGTSHPTRWANAAEFEIWGDDTPLSSDAQTPNITKQPQSAEYFYMEIPEALSVEASVTDNGELSYQWYKNDQNSIEGAQIVSGATDPVYLPSTEEIGETYYFCHIINRDNELAGQGEIETPIDSDMACITVKKANGTASVSIMDWVYGTEASLPVPESGTNGTESVIYLYKLKNADDSTYTEEVPAEIGDYTISAIFAETDYYNAVTVTADFSIIEQDTPEEIPVTGITLDTEELKL